MAQLEHIEAIEKRLWNVADTLRANSNYASNEYFLPVMGLIFLRHAYSRYLGVKDEIEANLPTRSGKKRALTKEDFSQKSAIFLQPKAQFDSLVALTDSDDRAKAIIEAMESIEADYKNLRGELPKSEYQELENSVLGQLLRTLNPDELKRASGDVFGRIYEYFLTQFADLKAHDNGEFFTPVSLVSLIANVLEPEGGTVLDPACGSGGMFVQSARFVEQRHQNPTDKLTFRGLEKNATTIRLAKMNLAVHGLEGDIQKAITYYEDPHELLGKADFVMANPPFNVDEIDAYKVKNDPRLPFGLPGVNKKDKVSNGNYIWISYFYSYLGEAGRSGFVMSSQASSAGRDEAKVRQKLIETGDVDLMVAVRSNFFYTRTVPCELWFLNRAKPEEHRNKVLMIDARHIYRKVTRKIYDFSPEQEQNLLAIVWLYRGRTDRFLDLVAGYCTRMLYEGDACFSYEDDDCNPVEPLPAFSASLMVLRKVIKLFLDTLGDNAPPMEMAQELDAAAQTFTIDVGAFKKAIEKEQVAWKHQKTTNGALKGAVERLTPLAESSRDLIKQMDLLYKLACRLIEICENDCAARDSDLWTNREITRGRKAADEARQLAVEQLKQVRYFHRQARWLTERFPEAKLCDVEGLVKLVDRTEIEANDWSLTPGRYVGVAPEEVDENFDFEEALRDIHVELEDLNAEAAELGVKIKKNFEELGDMSWQPKGLDELGLVSRGRSRHRPRDAAHLYGGSYPFIQTSDVKHANLYVTEFSQTYSEAGLAQSKMWKAGTLCITIAANIADTAILGIDACFPDSVIGFIPDQDKADALFIKYLFDALLQRQYKTFTQGAAQDNLSQAKLLSLKFPIPGLSEQQYIADILSAYDDLIENNRRRIQLLEQVARLLYEEWFVHLRFPGHEHVKINDGLPDGWGKLTIGEASSFLKRGITPKYDEGAKGLVINQKCIRNRLVNMSLARRQSKEVPPPKMVQYGDVLINSTGQGTLGRVAQFIDQIENCTVDSHITIVRPAAGIPKHYFGFRVSSMEDYLATMGRGATNQTELSKDTIADIPFILPPKSIAEDFELTVGNTSRQIKILTHQNYKLTEARDLLLPRLMNGEMTV